MSERVVLNAYEIIRPLPLRLSRRIYRFSKLDGTKPRFTDHGAVIDAVWSFKFARRDVCSGSGRPAGYSIDQIAIPPGWKIPDGPLNPLFSLALVEERDLSTANPADDKALLDLLSKHVANRFFNSSGTLGDLWKHFGRPTQKPDFAANATSGVALCRSFDLAAKRFAGDRIALTVNILSTPVATRSIADYLRDGSQEELAATLESKRHRRTKRDGTPLDVNVWRDGPEGGEVLTLTGIDQLISIAKQSKDKCAAAASGTVSCSAFKKPALEVPASSLHLILDTAEVGEYQSDAILSPDERVSLMRQVRSALTPLEFEGTEIHLADHPMDCEGFAGGTVAPPSVVVKGDKGPHIIDVGRSPTDDAIRRRARDRAKSVVRNGFWKAEPVVPLLAVPHFFTEKRLARLKAEFETVLADCGAKSSLATVAYRNPEQIEKAGQELEATCALVVLPEKSHVAYTDHDTHEKVKKKVSIPNQCLHLDSTQPEATVDRSLADLAHAKDPHSQRIGRRTRQKYEICVSNLLVKLGNVPFAPTSPFHYNTHVGLDVGGVHNNTVVVSMGQGFAKPDRDLAFRCEKIDLSVSKAEPVPPKALSRGFVDLFERAKTDLEAAGQKADFESVLIFRDGRLLGVEGQMNEIDALREARETLIASGACTTRSRWTAVEVSKEAQGLRFFSVGNTTANVLTGTWRQVFDDPDSALVVTTGRPYVPQGTADPAKLTVVPISDGFVLADVVRDYVWDADLSFTKPDMSLSLPWTLKIADQGALDYAKWYKVSGITAS